MNISAIGNEYMDALLYDQNRWKGKVNFDTYFTIAYSIRKVSRITFSNSSSPFKGNGIKLSIQCYFSTVSFQL